MSTHYGYPLYTVFGWIQIPYKNPIQHIAFRSGKKKNASRSLSYHSHLNTFLQFLNQKYKNLC